MHPVIPAARRTLAYHTIPFVYLLLAARVWPYPPVCGFGDIDIEIYSVIARMWSRGFLPYADFYDFKPPLTFLLLRLGFAAWGPDATVIWKLQVILVTCTAIALFYVLLRRDRPASAVMGSAAVLTLLMFDAGALRQFLRNSELWAVLPLVVSLALLSHPHRSEFPYSACLAGLGFGFALTAKQQAGPFLLPLLWLVCHEGWSLSAPRRLSGTGRALVLFGLGACLPLAVFALYFAWHGALSAAVNAVVINGLNYAALPDLRALPFAGGRLRVLLGTRRFLSQPSLVPYVVCVFGALILAERKSRDRVSILLVCLAPILAALLSPTFYLHYVVLFVPALVFAVVQAGNLLLGPGTGAGSFRSVGVLLFLAALVFGAAVVTYEQGAPLFVQCPHPRDALLMELGRSIAARARADDRLLAWNLPPCLYVYADVPPAVRFFYDVPYGFGYEALRDDLNRALAQKPAFIAVSDPDTQFGRLETTADDLRRLLREGYEPLTGNASGTVFIRRRPASNAPIEGP